MARTALTVNEGIGRYPTLPIGANDADVEFEAADAEDKNSFAITGREVLIAYNSSGGALTVTVDSVADVCNREGDLGPYSIGAGEYALLGPFPVAGFRQADGLCYLEASGADVGFMVIRFPS